VEDDIARCEESCGSDREETGIARAGAHQVDGAGPGLHSVLLVAGLEQRCHGLGQVRVLAKAGSGFVEHAIEQGARERVEIRAIDVGVERGEFGHLAGAHAFDGPAEAADGRSRILPYASKTAVDDSFECDEEAFSLAVAVAGGGGKHLGDCDRRDLERVEAAEVARRTKVDNEAAHGGQFGQRVYLVSTGAKAADHDVDGRVVLCGVERRPTHVERAHPCGVRFGSTGDDDVGEAELPGTFGDEAADATGPDDECRAFGRNGMDAESAIEKMAGMSLEALAAAQLPRRSDGDGGKPGQLAFSAAECGANLSHDLGFAERRRMDAGRDR
jgi:hypothetical protein